MHALAPGLDPAAQDAEVIDLERPARHAAARRAAHPPRRRAHRRPAAAQRQSGSLFEGIAVWAERVGDLTDEDVQARAREVLRWQLANGVQHVRSHVDVCDPDAPRARALIELREEVRGVVDLQLVAFPQQGILAFDGGEALMRRRSSSARTSSARSRTTS